MDSKVLFKKLGIAEKINSAVEKIEGKNDTPDNKNKINNKNKTNDKPETDKNFNETDYEKNNTHTNFMSVQQIYNNLNMEKEGINTIYIIDNFSKALPENLPTEVKKQSVLGLISASDMKLETLTQDGEKRLSELMKFMDGFSQKTEKVISESKLEIKKLEQQINKFKKIIKDREKLQEEQKATVNYEIERVQNIMDFIGSDKTSES